MGEKWQKGQKYKIVGALWKDEWKINGKDTEVLYGKIKGNRVIIVPNAIRKAPSAPHYWVKERKIFDDLDKWLKEVE